MKKFNLCLFVLLVFSSGVITASDKRIINGTAAGLTGQLPAIPDDCLSAGGWTYDMMYASKPTAFVQWGRSHGGGKALDGLGMLVEQAAESFYLWRGVRPETSQVIASLRA